MASPSPLDRCWVVKDSPGSLPIMPHVRAAVERHWPDTQRAAASVLGDETLAAEIMEGAIEEADCLPCRPSARRSRRCERSSLSLLQAGGWATAQGTQVTRLHRSFFCSRTVHVLFANFCSRRSDRRGKNSCRCPTQSARSADDAVRQLRVLERRGGQNGHQPRSDTKEMQKVSRPYPTKIGNSGCTAVNSGKGTSRDREGFSGRASVVFQG